MPVSADEFRAALSRFASGVTVVTSGRGMSSPECRNSLELRGPQCGHGMRIISGPPTRRPSPP